MRIASTLSTIIKNVINFSKMIDINFSIFTNWGQISFSFIEKRTEKYGEQKKSMKLPMRLLNVWK